MENRKTVLSLTAGIVLAAFGSPYADHMELITDRPDRSESSHTVPRGSMQIESGWGFARHEEGRITEERHEILGSLLRYGLNDRVEFRLGWSGYLRQSGAGEIEKGAGDATLGTKIFMWEEKGVLPEAAFLAGVSLPVGEEHFTSHEPDPSFRYAFSHSLSDRFGLSYNLGASWVTELHQPDEKHTHSFFNYTAAFSMELNSRMGLFTEFFGDIPFNSGHLPANNLDGGLTFLILENLQLDLAAGAGLSKETDDWFLGLGVSARFPK